LSPFPTRRKFLQICAASGVLGAIAVAGDGLMIEPNMPILVSIEVPLSRLHESWEGFRIAHLSDFHYDDYFSVVPLRRAIDIVNRLQPDLIVLTGDFVTAAEAERIGLYNRVVPANELATATRAFAEQLARGPAFALGKTKEMLDREFHMDFAAALESEAQAQAVCMKHPDYREAYEAFVAKREAKFK